MMTRDEKKKRAIIAAVAQFIQDEEDQLKSQKNANAWGKSGKARIMDGNRYVQRRGRTVC